MQYKREKTNKKCLIHITKTSLKQRFQNLWDIFAWAMSTSPPPRNISHPAHQFFLHNTLAYVSSFPHPLLIALKLLLFILWKTSFLLLNVNILTSGRIYVWNLPRLANYNLVKLTQNIHVFASIIFPHYLLLFALQPRLPSINKALCL